MAYCIRRFLHKSLNKDKFYYPEVVGKQAVLHRYYCLENIQTNRPRVDILFILFYVYSIHTLCISKV